MSNGSSSSLPWILTGVSGVVAALAVGFMAGRYTAPEVPAPAPMQQGQQAQDPNQLPPGTTVENIEDWSLICQEANGQKGCVAVQQAVNAEQQLVLIVEAGYDDKAQRMLRVRTPLGVVLQNGVEFTIPGGEPQAYNFAACDQASCIAVLNVPEEGYTKLEAAGSFELAYTRQDGARVPATMSMKGLTAAYAKVPKPAPAAAPAEAPATTPPAETPPAETPAPANP